MHKVLVIGGNGFIGKNVVSLLKERKIQTAIYDISDSLLDVESYKGDIVNDPNFDKIVGNYDTIIYLITVTSPQKSMIQPCEAYMSDIPLLIKTLDTAKDNHVKRVIFSSSGGSIYGNSPDQGSKESDLVYPINNYAICKLTCEHILDMYNKLYGMENIVLRIANPYGNGQKLSSGVGAITTFVKKIIDGEEINLFGDGNIKRDFIDIQNVSEAFYEAVNYKFIKEIDPIFNIGSSVPMSLKEIIKIIEDELNVKAKINYLPERNFDVKINFLNIDKSRKFLNYRNNDDEIEHIRNYIQYLLKNKKESNESVKKYNLERGSE